MARRSQTQTQPNLKHDTIRKNIAYIGRLMQDLLPNEWTDQDAFVLEQLTNFVINSTYFHCPDLQATYHQVVGQPMGTNCAPELANLVLLAIEMQHLANFEYQSFLMLRYIDDIIVIGTTELINKVPMAYRDTGLALTENEEGTFLDLHITMVKKYENFATPMWHFNFQVYQKPLNKYMYKRYDSCTPIATKKGLIIGELVRYARLSSSFTEFNNIRTLLLQRLIKRGYHKPFVERLFREFNYYHLVQQYQASINWKSKIDHYKAKLDVNYIKDHPSGRYSTPTMASIIEEC